jgi:hypothetical protein
MAIKSEVQQPHVIRSADGKLEIIHNRSYVDRFGCYCVEGAVRNKSRDSHFNVEIKIDLFNGDKELIDTEIDSSIVDLTPGATVAFHTMYSGKRRVEIKHYEIQLKNNNF